MALSSGGQRAITEAITWASAGAFVLVGLIYHNEIRTALGMRYEPPQQTAGTPARGPAKPAVSEEAPRSDEERTERRQGRDIVRLKADASGHFFAKAYINGSLVNVLVDTGATSVALTWDDARAAGIRVQDSDFTAQSRTANGIAYFAPVTIGRVSVGDIELSRIQAFVAKPNQLTVTLLGMSFLGKLGVEMKDRELVLSH